MSTTEEPIGLDHPSNLLEHLLARCEPIMLDALVEAVREVRGHQAVNELADTDVSDFETVGRDIGELRYTERGPLVRAYSGWWDLQGHLVTGDAVVDPVLVAHRQRNTFYYGERVHSVALTLAGRHAMRQGWQPADWEPPFVRDRMEVTGELGFDVHALLTALRPSC